MTVLYSPDGTMVNVSNPDRVAQLQGRGWTLTKPPSVLVTVPSLLQGNPFYVAHRGFGDSYPEHTMVAYTAAVASGAQALEVSAQVTADGVLVCLHDADMARMTGTAGAAENFSWAQLKNAFKIKAQPLLGSGWADVEMALFEDVIDEFYGQVVLVVEPKTTAAVEPLKNAILALGPNSRQRIIWKSHYSAASLTWAKANGYITWAYVDTTTTSAQMDAVDANVDMWGVPHTSTDAHVQMVVAHTPVKPVMVWEIHRRFTRDKYLAMGVKGMMTSSSHVLRNTPIDSVDHWSTKIASPGDLGVGDNVVNDAMLFEGTSEFTFKAAPNRSICFASKGPITHPSYRIQFDAKWDTLPGATDHLGIAFGKASDDRYQFGVSDNPSGGYHALFRRDASFGQVYTHAANTAAGTQIGSQASFGVGAIAGQWMTFQVDVTPTQVIWRRTDGTPVSVTVNNTAHRGGYFHLLGGNNATLANVAHYRGLSVVAL